ncbi:MAG: 6-phospho-3-hexuloisomerase [Mesorhizobium sp.]
MSALTDALLDELRLTVARVDERAVDDACAMLAQAGRIVVCGCGREALQMKGLAMRLFHLGLPVSVAGDMTAPPLGAGDLLFASSGPGETGTILSLMRTARGAGATVLLITAQPTASAAGLADCLLVVPAQTMADDRGEKRSSAFPMGSLFEGAMFVLFEAMVLKLKQRLGVTDEAMRARHTNLE